MEKQKKAPTFNFKKALAAKIKSKLTLSQIEFNLCSEEQKKEYILSKSGEKLIDYETKWCEENNIDTKSISKLKMLKSGVRLYEVQLAQYSPEELVEYIESLLNKYDFLNAYEKKLVTKERYQKWLHDLIDNNKWITDDKDFHLLTDDYKRKYAKFSFNNLDEDMPFEMFEWLDEDERIMFVVNNGLYNLGDAYKKWFKSWKKSHDRQKQIDSVLR
jgi:hypothetical protein